MDFARGAWREAWAPMAVTGFGWLLIVVGGHAQVTPEVADIATKDRLGIAGCSTLPLLGALYRLGVGGQAYRGLGPGGLQLGGVEGRVAAVNAVLAFFCLLTCLPMIVLSRGLLPGAASDRRRALVRPVPGRGGSCCPSCSGPGFWLG